MKKMFLCAFTCVFLVSCSSNQPAEDKTTATPAAETKPQPAEFADTKYMDLGKKNLAAMSSGDIDAWTNSFADNAVYFWNNGDSVAGKAAIGEYWKKRRTEIIDSITFSHDIWLPVKVNEPQQPEQRQGIWLLSWYKVDAKYKTGKSMTQWMHADFHFDANDKIDVAIQYLDRVPINAATTK